MRTNTYKNYIATDFLKDKDFLRWQLLKRKEDLLFWQTVIDEYPFLRSRIEEAVLLYKKSVRINDFSMSYPDISDNLISLQEQIRIKKKKRNSIRFLFYISSISASIALILSLPLFFNKDKEVQNILTFAQTSFNDDDLNSSDVKLILSENNTVVLNKNNKESSIEYKEGTIKADDNLIPQKNVSSYNQLVVPYGKRSVITFSDGTKAWVNAGSKLTYPATFSREKREIYMDGEIYIEVAEDKKCPFVIKTKHMAITVLGTKFNVSAYQADSLNSVVLLSGSVSISPDMSDKNIVLKPDQMYSNIEGLYTVQNVDASIYILWTEGLYQFESENLAHIVTRFERYYGIRMECDAVIAELKCSGKIDLKEDKDKLFEELSRALPITYRQNSDGSYMINAKY